MKNLSEICALKKAEMKGKVLGRFGAFSIEQKYENKSKNVVEVFYTFPISASGVVSGFHASIGDKEVVGKVFEKQEAKERYQEALTQGNSAYLMENQGGNVFKIAVGKVAPNEIVKIKIDYLDVFEIIQNRLDLRIPTVVAPRYNDKVTSSQKYKSELDYKAFIEIEIDKIITIKDVNCTTHACMIKDNIATVKNAKLDKDFVLSLEFDNKDKQKSNGLVYESEKETYAFLQFMPHLKKPEKQEPKNFVFIVDCSGSMEGKKIEKTKKAIIKSLELLDENDTFQIIVFGNRFNKLVDTTQATKDELEKAVCIIKIINANMGGTEIFEPIKSVIDGKDNQIILLFTDGEIGQEENKTINTFLRTDIRNNHFFVFGIDDAVNMAVLNEIALNGNGKAEYFSISDDLDEKIIRQFSRINQPMATNIKLNFGNNKVLDSLPYDKALFNNEYWQAVLKLERLNGKFCIEFDGGQVDLDEITKTDLPLDKIFAAQKIKQIQKTIDDNRYDDSVDGYKKQIVKLSTEYGISSEHTSFLIVNERGDKIFDNAMQEQIALESPSNYVCDQMADVRMCCYSMPMTSRSLRNLGGTQRMKRLKDFVEHDGCSIGIQDYGIKIDHYQSGKNVLLILTGAGGDVKGFENKYEKIAEQIQSKYNATVFVAGIPKTYIDNAQEIMQYILNYVDMKMAETKQTNYDVYAFGFSAGATIILWHNELSTRIKKIVSVNPVLSINYNKAQDGLANFKGTAKAIFGDKDPSFNLAGLLKNYAEIITLPDTDHQFTNKVDEFIALPEKYLYNKRAKIK